MNRDYRMNISVIVPLYKGNKYIDGIVGMIESNMTHIREVNHEIEVELLFVNDYPDMPVQLDCLKKDLDFNVRVIENSENQGIHQSRVNGIEHCKGDYILMLDQDDFITDDAILSQASAIGNADIVIGNGYKMKGQHKRLIYRNTKKQLLATRESVFLYAANQIVSPGHCLIKKDAVPKEWMNYIIKKNGGDDLFLWLLMFEKGCVFTVNFHTVYTHVDTGENLSLDLKKMYDSSDNIIRLANETNSIRKEAINIYERRIEFLKKLLCRSQLKKVFACIRNFDICVYKLWAYYR